MPPVRALCGSSAQLPVGWDSFKLISVCFCSFPVPSVPVELLQGAQRGAVQAAAQAGAAAAIVAAPGAAEGQVAPGDPARPLLPPQTPRSSGPSGSPGQDLTDTALPSKNKPTNHQRIKKTPTRQLFVCTCCQWSSPEPFCPRKAHGAPRHCPGSRPGSVRSPVPPSLHQEAPGTVCRTDRPRIDKLQSVRTRAKDGNGSRWTGRLVTCWAFSTFVFKYF